MSCWGGACLNHLHSNHSQNVSLLTLPRESLRWKLCREMSCLGGADLHHLLSYMFCNGLAKRCFSCWVAASRSLSSNFSLEVSYPSSSTRLKIHSEGEVCHTACFSLKKTDALYRNFLNYAWIFECVFHWSCKEMSVVLVGWMGGAELHHLPADLSYQRLPDITSQLLLHFICFFYLHLRNCYHATSFCFGLSTFSASSLKSRISVSGSEKNI